MSLLKNKIKSLLCSNLLLFVIIITSFICCIFNLRKGHNWGGDFSLYIHQAKAIIQGGIGQLAEMNKSIVAESSDHSFSPTLYPWGFPIILSLVLKFCGIDYTAFKFLEIFFFCGALSIFYNLIRKTNKLNKTAALLIIALLGQSYFYINYTNNVLSELPFLFFIWSTLLFINNISDSNSKEYGYLTSTITGFFIFFSFSIRTEGVGLFLSLFTAQIQYYYSSWKTISIDVKRIVCFLLPYIVFIILYLLMMTILPIGFTSHFSYRKFISKDVMIDNILFYFNGLSTVSGNFFSTSWISIFLIISASGVIIRFKRDLPLISFLFFLLILFSIWPFHEYRYLLSIYPLLLYFFVHGILYLFDFKDNIRYASYIFLVVMLAITILKNIENIQINYNNKNEIVEGPETPESQEVFSYIKRYTNNKDVIIFFRPRVMNLYTNRKSLAIFDNIKNIQSKGNYYVMKINDNSFFQIFIAPEQLKQYPFLEEIYSNQQFIIYKINK